MWAKISGGSGVVENDFVGVDENVFVGVDENVFVDVDEQVGEDDDENEVGNEGSSLICLMESCNDGDGI